MSDFLENIISTVLFMLGAVMAFFIIALLVAVEWVLPTTFEEGLVKVDAETSYICKPTERTLKIREQKKKLEEFKKLQEALSE